MNAQLHSAALSQLQALGNDKRIVFVHPGYTDQHRLLSSLSEASSIYHRFSHPANDYTEVNAQFIRSAREQIGVTAPPHGTIVILEDCDIPEAESFKRFLVDLLSTTEIARVFVFCRNLPFPLTEIGSLSNAVALVPLENEIMLTDFTLLRRDQKLLEVRAFGEGRASLNGVGISSWDGTLPRILFLYLIDRGMATRQEIFETFWPNLKVKEATNVFHVTKRKLNENLGFDLTIYRSGFYRISPEIELHYDVIRFSEMIQESAVAPTEEAISLLEKAVALYRDSFLSALQSGWAKRRREVLAADYVETLEVLGDMLSETGQSERAVSCYLRAVALQAHREILIEKIMRILYRERQLKEALGIFRHVFSNNGSTPMPGKDQEQLFELARIIEKEAQR